MTHDKRRLILSATGQSFQLVILILGCTLEISEKLKLMPRFHQQNSDSSCQGVSRGSCFRSFPCDSNVQAGLRTAVFAKNCLIPNTFNLLFPKLTSFFLQLFFTGHNFQIPSSSQSPEHALFHWSPSSHTEASCSLGV